MRADLLKQLPEMSDQNFPTMFRAVVQPITAFLEDRIPPLAPVDSFDS